jgi:hypothetical protein
VQQKKLALEFRRRLVSERFLFETQSGLHCFLEQHGCCFVAKPVAKSKLQNLTSEMSFDTTLVRPLTRRKNSSKPKSPLPCRMS